MMIEDEQGEHQPVRLLSPADIRERFTCGGTAKPPSERLIRRLIRESGCFRKAGRAILLTEDDFQRFLDFISCSIGRPNKSSLPPAPPKPIVDSHGRPRRRNLVLVHGASEKELRASRTRDRRRLHKAIRASIGDEQPDTS